MGSYLVRRFGLMLLTLFGISVIIFHAAAPDAGQHRRHPVRCRRASSTRPRRRDHGRSRSRQAAAGAIRAVDRRAAAAAISAIPTYPTGRRSTRSCRASRSPRKVAGLALTFAVLIGVPLGVISAVKQNTRLDYVLRVISLSGLSMPAFWLGLLILMVFRQLFRHDPDLHRRAAVLLGRARDVQRAGGGRSASAARR